MINKAMKLKRNLKYFQNIRENGVANMKLRVKNVKKRSKEFDLI